MTKPDPFNQEERDHYRNMVALFINGDPAKKKRLDKTARMQLASAKETLPQADNETLVTFMLSMAFAMARVLSTPVGDISELAHAVFQNNITAAAGAMGIYDFDDPEDMPAYVEEKAGPDKPSADDDSAIEEIINRQYL